MKRPYRILLILLGAIALVVVVAVVNVKRSHQQVRGVEVDVHYGRTPMLVHPQVVRDSVLAALPDITTMRVMDVDRRAVSVAAAHVPYLCNVSTSVSVSGKVVVHATQRRPIARLFYGRQELYFDTEGALFPVGQTGDCDVLVIGGDFAEPLRVDSLNSQLQQLLTLATFLDTQRQYRGLIDQVFIERDGNVLMVPKLGNHIVELGSVDNLELKFSNLLTFYRQGMPRAGWETYKRISLKFDGQVVCTKDSK